MAQNLDEKEIVSFKEMLMANSKMVDALAQLLIQKGVFTEQELYAKLKDCGPPIPRRKADRLMITRLDNQTQMS
jgi:hypothetical protein